MLKKPELSDAAEDFYQARQVEHVDYHRRMAASQYARVSDYFGTSSWARRALTASAHDLPREAPVRHVDQLGSAALVEVAPEVPVVRGPVVSGEFIELRDCLSRQGQRPIAYLRGVPATDLLARLGSKQPICTILDAWEQRIGAANARLAVSDALAAGLIRLTDLRH